VREAERELQVGAACLHAVPDADDLELLLVALGDTLDHVRDERAGQAVKGLARALVVRPDDLDDGVVTVDREGFDDVVRQRPLGALDRHHAAVDADVHAGGYRDGELADAGHVQFLSGYQT